MIRNLKALGLALVAMLAMGAMAAASASAQEGEIYETNGAYPAHIQGSDVAPGVGEPTAAFTRGEEVIECSTATYTSNLTAASKRLTITPGYSGCTHATTPITVTMNGCHYEFHHATTTAGNPDGWTVTADVVCPVGKVIEVHDYATHTKHTEGKSKCTITIGAQTGRTGAEITEETDANDSLKIEGTIHSIAAQTHGECSFGFTINVNTELHLSATVTATEEKKIGIKD